MQIETIQDASVKSLARNVYTALNTHYPAYRDGWNIIIDTRDNAKIMQVRNMYLSGKMGFIMKLDDIDPEMRKVVRNAGELLERYRVSRNKAVELRDELDKMAIKPSGEAVFDQ